MFTGIHAEEKNNYNVTEEVETHISKNNRFK